jgi:hypothetical protein
MTKREIGPGQNGLGNLKADTLTGPQRAAVSRMIRLNRAKALKINMKKTVKYILGATVALAMTASGAFADPIVIDHLPVTINAPGDYHLQLPPDYPPIEAYAISIVSSDVNLDLNGNQIDCVGGIRIADGPLVSHISIKNGTFNNFDFNGTYKSVFQGAVYVGIAIFNANHVSVENVNFNGAFGYNADWGTYDSFKNCNFESPLAAGDSSLSSLGHNTYENLTVSTNSYGDSGGYPNNNDPTLHRALYSPGFSNSFKNIRVLSGNVYLGGPLDTYDHFFVKGDSTVTGGTNLKPGK